MVLFAADELKLASGSHLIYPHSAIDRSLQKSKTSQVKRTIFLPNNNSY